MILNTLNAILEQEDLQRLAVKAIEGVGKVKEMSVTLEEGIVVLSGKMSVGFTIPFSTEWKTSPCENGYQLSLSLSRVSVGMVGIGEEMISGQILTLLKNKLEAYDAVGFSDKNIIVDLKKVLEPKGISLTAPVQGINITPAGIELIV